MMWGSDRSHAGSDFRSTDSGLWDAVPKNTGTPVNKEERFDKIMVSLWFEEFDQKVYTFEQEELEEG